MKNNKGFTLIEILATIVILGILSVAAVVGYSKYLQNARQKAYDVMAKSATDATAEYSMEHTGVSMVTFSELTKGDYLEYPSDPSNKANACTGIVTIAHNNGNVYSLDEDEYFVTICCANYSYSYHFPGGSKEKVIDVCPIE